MMEINRVDYYAEYSRCDTRIGPYCSQVEKSSQICIAVRKLPYNITMYTRFVVLQLSTCIICSVLGRMCIQAEHTI